MYQFTTKNPPLFNDHLGQPFDLDPSELERLEGIAEWSIRKIRAEQINPPLVPLHLDFLHNFKATRKLKWILQIPLMQFAERFRLEVTKVSGYSKVKAQQFERQVGIKISGSFAKIFSAEVQASLKLTSSVQETWKEEKTMSGRNTVRATLGREFPTRTLSVCAVGP